MDGQIDVPENGDPCPPHPCRTVDEDWSVSVPRRPEGVSVPRRLNVPPEGGHLLKKLEERANVCRATSIAPV